MQSQKSLEEEQGPAEDQPEADVCDLEEAKVWNILAIRQDFVTCRSGGRKKMPNHLGFGLTIKTMVGGKEIIPMLNHHRHRIRYWECKEIGSYLI